MSKKTKPNPDSFLDAPPVPVMDGAPAFTESTFQMLGDQLPIGLFQGGELHRVFSFLPYNMRVERVVATIRKKHPHPAAYVPRILGALLSSLGPHADFQALDENSRMVIISQMWLGDVMYCWFQLRRAALGDELSASLQCPSCEERYTFCGDLSQADVKVTTGPDSLTWRYELIHGVPVKEETVKSVVLQHPRWNSMMSLARSRKKNSIDPVQVRIALTHGALRQVGDGTSPFTMDIMDEMTKLDMERLQKEIDVHACGPDLTLECVCTHCSYEHRIPVSWEWDFFFTAASL